MGTPSCGSLYYGQSLIVGTPPLSRVIPRSVFVTCCRHHSVFDVWGWVRTFGPLTPNLYVRCMCLKRSVQGSVRRDPKSLMAFQPRHWDTTDFSHASPLPMLGLVMTSAETPLGFGRVPLNQTRSCLHLHRTRKPYGFPPELVGSRKSQETSRIPNTNAGIALWG